MPEGLSPQDTYFVRKNLLTWGFIKRLDTGTYEITEDGRKFKSKVKTKRVGDSVPVAYDCVLKMTIPILRTNGIVPQNHSLGFLWWLKKYKDLDFLNPSITGPTNKSNLIIDIPRFTIPEDEELEFIVNKIKEYAKEFYLVKNIMELDTIHARVSSIKIGIHDEKFTQSVENKKIEGVQRRIYLGRDRSKILPEDKSETAYVEAPCTTPLKWTIHSNDGEYLDNYMLMPERLKNLENIIIPTFNNFSVALNKFSKEYEKHSKATDRWEKAATTIIDLMTNEKKTVYFVENKHKDRSLKEWLE